MLVTLNDVLKKKKKGKYAVGLFNAVNLKLARGIIEAAEAASSPVIVGTAEVLFPYGSLEEVSYTLLSYSYGKKIVSKTTCFCYKIFLFFQKSNQFIIC